jgi:two-component system sensor histidine kinase ResE
MEPRKRNWSISIKLWAAMMILILGVLGGLGIAITWLFSDFYINQKLVDLGNDAKEISTHATSLTTWAERLTSVQNTKLKPGTQLVVLNSDGELITYRANISNTGTFGNYAPWNGGMGLNGSGVLGSTSWWIHPLLPNYYFTQDNLKQVLAGKTLTIKAIPSKRTASAGSPIGVAATSIA